MKTVPILTAVIALCLSACRYEAPLDTENKIDITPAMLGLWEAVPKEHPDTGPAQRLLILKFSETEYLVHHPLGEKSIYYRAYPIRVGSISCVQLQVIGNEQGLVKDDPRIKLYQVVSYRLTTDKLEVRTLNSDLFNEDLKTTVALREEFLKHKDDESLFGEATIFRKVKN